LIQDNWKNLHEAEIRTVNAERQKWNQTVDEAIVAGVSEEKQRGQRQEHKGADSHICPAE
jgi:hypothetical protein